MPDRDPIVLTRPDGSLLTVTPEEAEILQQHQYAPEDPQLAYERAVEAGREEYYTRPGQRVKTGFEGVLSGVSLSASDVVLDALGADTAARAEANPGLRLATEFGGALLPSVIAPGSGIGAILGKTPAGLLARGASRIAPALTASRAGQAAVRAGVEGAGYGAAAEVTQSVLNGDPLTAEAVIAGAGFRSLIGAAAGGLFRKLDEVPEGYPPPQLRRRQVPKQVIPGEN